MGFTALNAHAGDASQAQLPKAKQLFPYDAGYGAFASAQGYTPVGPAVDGLNWKADALGGSLGHMSIAGVRGVVAMPVGKQFGLQFDLSLEALAATASATWLAGTSGAIRLTGCLVST